MMRIKTLTTAGLLLAAAVLGGCDDYSEVSELYERMPQDEGLDCMSVCQSVMQSDRCESVITCEEVLTLEGVPGVVCVFEYYNPPKLTG